MTRNLFIPKSISLAIALGCGLVSVDAMTVAELQKGLASGTNFTVIDVRTTPEFTRGHIPGAINVPTSICAQKNLPPLGKVIVYDSGLAQDHSSQAATALAAKPGVTVDILNGGFAAWESAETVSTRERGMSSEALNYITYDQLKAEKAGDILLVDLRSASSGKPTRAAGADTMPLTDLAREFPNFSRTKSLRAKSSSADSSTPPLLILIDDGDGKAQASARSLKNGGTKRYAILAGGELILARHGQRGLQRNGPTVESTNTISTSQLTTH